MNKAFIIAAFIGGISVTLFGVNLMDGNLQVCLWLSVLIPVLVSIPIIVADILENHDKL